MSAATIDESYVDESFMAWRERREVWATKGLTAAPESRADHSWRTALMAMLLHDGAGGNGDVGAEG